MRFCALRLGYLAAMNMTPRRRILFVPILALTLLGQLVAPACAEETDPQDGPRAPVDATSSHHVAITNRSELESLLGREVKTRVEGDAGRIIDLLVDPHGRVQAALIEFGGFLGIGTRKIAVAWSALRFESEGKKPVVIVDLTRDQLRASPEYKPREPDAVRQTSD
jgi:hypothetical protein